MCIAFIESSGGTCVLSRNHQTKRAIVFCQASQISVSGIPGTACKNTRQSVHVRAAELGRSEAPRGTCEAGTVRQEPFGPAVVPFVKAVRAVDWDGNAAHLTRAPDGRTNVVQRRVAPRFGGEDLRRVLIEPKRL